MSLDTIQIREVALSDLDAVADIYSALWCNRLRESGQLEDERLVARFNVAMQLNRSPLSFVATDGDHVIAACFIGIFDNGTPRVNPTWEPVYQDLLAQATERAKTCDARLEGNLFGDSREKATADAFAATGSDYAQGQLNLIIILPEYQGRGLGRRLIEHARAELRKLGCSKFFLMSDNRSDYEFYDHLGMERIAENHDQDTGDGFIVYVYGDEA
mgnify:CR=1 FL=1